MCQNTFALKLICTWFDPSVLSWSPLKRLLSLKSNNLYFFIFCQIWWLFKVVLECSVYFWQCTLQFEKSSNIAKKLKKILDHAYVHKTHLSTTFILKKWLTILKIYIILRKISWNWLTIFGPWTCEHCAQMPWWFIRGNFVEAQSLGHFDLSEF